jgi:hypothetical protein
MACKVCHRQGLCIECCCINSDHVTNLPNLTECRLCKHPIPRRPK